MCYFPKKIDGKLIACGNCYCCRLAKRNGFYRSEISPEESNSFFSSVNSPKKLNVLNRLCAIIRNILKI